MASPSRAASTAQILALALTASLIALAPVPEHWLVADPSLSAIASTRGGVLAVWHGLARALPIADLWPRVDLLAVVLALGLASVTTRAAQLVFRGPGRLPAAIVAGPLAALPAFAWAREVGSGQALDALCAAIFATLAITAVVRSRVHLGGVAPIAAARACAATLAVVLFSPRTFAVLVVVVFVAVVLGAKKLVERGTHGSARAYATATIAAGALPALAIVALAIVSPPADALSILTLDLRSGLPSTFAPTMSATLVHAGLALAIVSAFVLRWRGGPLLLAWIGAAGWIVDEHGPLVVVPVLHATLAIAVAGWAWLAGTMLRKRERVAVAFAWAAAFAVIGVGPVGDAERPAPVADSRPVHAFSDMIAHGLVGPRDVVVLHDAALLETLADRRAVEGWRPDVLLVDGRALAEDELAMATLGWRDEGRRLLSDSWSLGGRWRARWALDSGPLFWFVGPMQESEHDFTDLGPMFPDLGAMRPDEALPWVRLAVERARYRRELGAPDAALASLPLSAARHRGLLTRLQLARSAKPEPGAGSELDERIVAASVHGWIAAEAGDLLFSHGEQQRATELLAEAANAGWTPAWGALARWQLRAGLDDAARETLDAMADDPALRDELLAVAWWMLRRDRLHDARSLLARLEGHGPAPASELAVRLAVLRKAAPGAAPSPPPADVSPAIGRAD